MRTGRGSHKFLAEDNGAEDIGGDRDMDSAPLTCAYTQGALVVLDLADDVRFMLLNRDGKRSRVRHPNGALLEVPAWRVWLPRGR